MADAIFLDCDGVVTDRNARVDADVMFEAHRLALAGKKVAFVSARSLTWMNANLVPALERFNPSEEERSRIFFVAEMGARWISFSRGGSLQGEMAGAVPASVRAEMKASLAKWYLLFFDEAKESMAAVEVRHDRAASSRQSMEEAQRQLGEAEAAFTARYPKFNVIRTLYAVDVMSKGAGKAGAVARALELAGAVREAVVVGDSPADLGMGAELDRRGIPLTFYYVGEREPGSVPFKLVKTKEKYSRGALEALRGVR